MRIFVYGMQSSGASLFTYWLSQLENYIGVIDLWATFYPAGRHILSNENIILKSTVSFLDLRQHLTLFEPDKKILFIRNPYHNYHSLSLKHYINDGGNINDKFIKMDKIFSEMSSLFDVIITYEDFIVNQEKTIKSLNQINIPMNRDHFKFNRSIKDIEDFNHSNSEWLKRGNMIYWGNGNIHQNNVQNNLKLINNKIEDKTSTQVNLLCPNLTKFYNYENNHPK
jgi:hypothetical protein